MLVRKDADVALLGQQAQLPPDLSPLQIGTRGRSGGHAFILVGRVRLGYEAGVWTEWCADYGNGHWGWVAEAQGLYYVSTEIAVPDDFLGKAELVAARSEAGSGRVRFANFEETIGRHQLALGRVLEIAGKEYVVRDVKTATVQGSEGELTFSAVPGRTALSADLTGDDGGFANVDFSADGIRIFVGRIVRYHELEFASVRPVPGWTSEAEMIRHQTEAMRCSACGGTVEIRAPGFSLAAACGHCGSVLDATDPQLRIIETSVQQQQFAPLIPLGTRGRFQGEMWEVLGFLRRRDNYGETWSEYLLFSPFAGYRWLVNYSGHWSVIDLMVTGPRMADWEPVDRGERHRLFAVSETEVTYVLGEFYWRVRCGERSMVRDFVAPPRILSEETYPGLAEKTWSSGEYVTPAEVDVAFGLKGTLPAPEGPYLNEPNPHRAKGRTLRWLLPLVGVLAVMIQLITSGNRRSEPLFEGALVYLSGTTNSAQVTDVFEVKRTRQALEFRVNAPVYNQWIEINMDLVDAATKAVREISVGVEYYHGFDDGEWSEGSTHGSAVLSGVKPGKYYLVVEPTADGAVTEMNYRIEVIGNVPLWSNLVLALVLLGAYPVYRWIRESAFEHRRWSVSDFSQYAGAQSSADADDD